MNPEVVSRIQPGERRLANGLVLADQVFGARGSERLFGGIKRRLRRRLEARLHGLASPAPAFVDQRTDLTADEFAMDYFRRSRPVIFSGAARDWPAIRDWSLESLAARYARSDLLLVESEGLTTRQARADHRFLRLRELVDDIRRGGESYLRFSPLLHEHPELADDLDMNWLASMRGGRTFGNTYYMFIGGAGRKTFLHADQPCNLYIQVRGEKKWTMFLPEDSVCLYPAVTNTAYVRSPIDLDRPDPARFPLFRHARPYIAHLRAGDVMYVPPHVWHQVENLSETIAVGYRFSSLSAAVRSSLTFSLIRILSTNPPVWKTRAYGRQDTNLIWAHTAGKIKEVLAQRESRRRDEDASL